MGIAHIELRPMDGMDKDLGPSFQKKKGRILHQALYFAREKEDLAFPEPLVKKAFFSLGEKMAGWDIEQDFLRPIKGLLELDEIDLFFPGNDALVLKEREFVAPGREGNTFLIHRPDRVVLYGDFAVVVEYKTEEGGEYYNLHKKQLLTYCEIVKKVFSVPVQPYLLYIHTRNCIRL